MSDLDGLLDDIREHPDDDTPRLVCADWFDDHG
ncbi:MAG: TIGR02996 domain-containing protein, partial [Gemmataceae bacterium]